MASEHIIEYGLIASLIAVAIVGILLTIGSGWKENSSFPPVELRSDECAYPVETANAMHVPTCKVQPLLFTATH